MEIKEIPIKEINFRENIRLKRDDTSAELMNSIKQTGLLQPVGVSKVKNSYTLIWGNRRLQACRNLGWKTIPATIFYEGDEEMSEEEFLIINSVENLQKKPNTLFELGRIAVLLRKKMSISEIASKLSMPKTRVESALLEFERIPKKWHKRIKLFGSGEEKKGDIPMVTATQIGRLRGLNVTQREALLNITSKNDLTGAEIVMLASLIRNGMPLKQAYTEMEKFKIISLRFGVNREKYNKILEDENYDNFIDFIIYCLNKEVSGFAFKISTDSYSK